MRQIMFYRSRGGGLISGYRWLPEGAPRAVVQLVHGITDYSQRYAHFAEYLNSLGYLVVAQDHMGHGESISEEAPAGYFSGGWFAAVDDTYQLYLDTRKKYPDIPYVLFGHSMGSLIARSILIRYPDSGIDAAVICGTVWAPTAVIRGGQMLAQLICRKNGEKHPSETLRRMMFGTCNARIENPRTPYDWLTRDEAVVDAYMADPFCTFVPTAGLIRDMLGGMAFIQKPENIARMNKDMPVLVISGGEDPVSAYGQSALRLAAEFEKTGIRNISTQIVPGCRHELHNELNKEEFFNDIANWIKSVLSD